MNFNDILSEMSARVLGASAASVAKEHESRKIQPEFFFSDEKERRTAAEDAAHKYEKAMKKEHKNKEDRIEWMNKDIENLRKHLFTKFEIKRYTKLKDDEYLKDIYNTLLQIRKSRAKNGGIDLVKKGQRRSAEADSTFTGSLENLMYANTNIEKRHGSVSPLTINGQKLSTILDNYKGYNANLKKSKLEVQFGWNDKKDGIVDGSIKYNVDNKVMFPLPSGENKIEFKQSAAHTMKVKGTMIFELGKVSTYSKALKILKSLGHAATIPTNVFAKGSPSAKKREAEIKIKEELEKISTEQESVKILFTEIARSGQIQKQLEEQLPDNLYLMVANRKQWSTTDKKFINNDSKSFVIKKLKDCKVDIDVKHWIGFARIRGYVTDLKQVDEHPTQLKLTTEATENIMTLELDVEASGNFHIEGASSFASFKENKSSHINKEKVSRRKARTAHNDSKGKKNRSKTVHHQFKKRRELEKKDDEQQMSVAVSDSVVELDLQNLLNEVYNA